MIPLVVTVRDLEGGDKVEQLAFIKSPVRIGRGELNELPLNRKVVSTYHGLVQFDDHSASYVDVGSLNGSLLGGVAVEKNVPVPIAPGAELIIGTFRLLFSRRVTAERAAVRRMTAFDLRASALDARVAVEPARALAGNMGSVAPTGGPRTTGPEPLDAAALAAGEEAIEAAALELDLQYTSYRGAWEHLHASLEAALRGLEGAARRAAVEKLAARYPSARAEPQFASLGDGAAVRPRGPDAVTSADPMAASASGRDELAAAALQLLTEFTEAYVGEARLETPREIEAGLGRIANVLETFGRSFVELLLGHEEFGSEMGVRTVQGDGAIYQARDARQLISYLLDPGGEGRERELQRAFTDFMLHQVALLRGVVEGARALLARVSPDEVAANAPKSVWPMRAVALWKAFEARFGELADEESAITEVLFGQEFARAYAAIVGEHAPAEEQGSVAPRPGRPRR